MKNVLLVLMLVFGASVFGQNKNAKAVIAVDGVCMMCKDRIEKEMQFTKGVTAVNLDIETQVLSITFKTKKNSVENIRTIIYLALDIGKI